MNLWPYGTDDATVLQGRAVEHLEGVARRVVEPDHLVDPAFGELSDRGLLVRRALDVEPVADVLQLRGIGCLPAGLNQPVVLTGDDHQAGWELVHPEIERTVGRAGALDHAEDLEAVLPPGGDVGGFDAQIAQ